MSCPRIRKVTYSLSKKQKKSKRKGNGNGKRSRKARGLSNTLSNQ